MIWLLACGGAPVVAPPPAVPRSVEAAEERLRGLGLREVRCEGGSLGDELSLLCTGQLGSRTVTVDAVTTGAPLPPPPHGVAGMADDLWVVVSDGTAPPDGLGRLFEGFTGVAPTHP